MVNLPRNLELRIINKRIYMFDPKLRFPEGVYAYIDLLQDRKIALSFNSPPEILNNCTELNKRLKELGLPRINDKILTNYYIEHFGN